MLEERLRHGWSSRDYRISPLPLKYPLPLPVPSLAVYPKFVKLGSTIYPGIYQTGYGRFRPNKSGHHLSCGYYRGGWTRLTQLLLLKLSMLKNSLR